jgi:hypothetical protein
MSHRFLLNGHNAVHVIRINAAILLRAPEVQRPAPGRNLLAVPSLFEGTNFEEICRADAAELGTLQLKAASVNVYAFKRSWVGAGIAAVAGRIAVVAFMAVLFAAAHPVT